MKTYFLHDTKKQKRLRAHPDPSTGFPAKWTLNESVAPPDLQGGLAYLERLEKPSYDPETQVLEPFNDYEAKTEGWIVRDKTENELRGKVPEAVSSWQVRYIAKTTSYNDNTLHDLIVASINNLDEDQKIKAEEIYLGGNQIYRYSELLINIISMIGLDNELVDQLFIEASKVNP